MVILYGHISKVGCLSPATALEDVWLALDMLPRFRWRWERKDEAGGHPLIAKLVEHVMGVSLSNVVPPTNSVLIPEPEWDETRSPTTKSQHSTPTLASAPGGYGTSSSGYGSHHSRGMNGMGPPLNRSNSGGSTPPDKQLVEMPDKLFYPFFPEAQVAAINSNGVPASASQGVPPSNGGQDYSQLLKTVAAAQGGYPAQPYPEGRDPAGSQQEMVWMSSMAR